MQCVMERMSILKNRMLLNVVGGWQFECEEKGCKIHFYIISNLYLRGCPFLKSGREINQMICHWNF